MSLVKPNYDLKVVKYFERKQRYVLKPIFM